MSEALTYPSEWRRHYCSASMPVAPALFVDRDGTLIENVPYLNDADRVALIPGATEMLMRFRSVGFRIVMVTNQSGIARGLCKPNEYEAVQERVLEVLGPRLFDAVYTCPFHPAGKGMFRQVHPWRKPAPGMLLSAAAELNLCLSESVMVGDSLADVQAGLAAGVKRVVHVLTGHGEDQRPGIVQQMCNDKRLSSVELANSVADLRP
jgi:D-glycero-D-manno-heptose 1,7-bisphosphate phosphatase